MLLLLIGGSFLVYKVFLPTAVERAIEKLQFDVSVTETEKQKIRDAVQGQAKTYDGILTTSVITKAQATNNSLVLAAYVPVTHVYATRQNILLTELPTLDIYIPADMDLISKQAIATFIGVEIAVLKTFSNLSEITDEAVAFIPAESLSSNIKLLEFENTYYLDTLSGGAIFREVVFTGSSAASLADLKLNDGLSKNTILKVNMTGVTAFTRLMMRKLNSVGSATYFSEKIGDFLADADITHVSNEVSFKTGCSYHDAVFCSPPEMIEALKDSGVDLVEITGNHNNDVGNQYNTETINLYHSLGWHTFGGGLNAVEAAKPYIADMKGSKIAFLGYNYPDSPNGGAIAKSETAGANSFDFDKIKADIEAAKQQSSFVAVHIQFWECYAYPAGYVEFPECDKPITNQKEVFRKVADLGANMIVGSSAHQPQTYEIYNGKPIYYGLGNMYFDQIQWPGTERGIILTHYFSEGKLLQTKLSPTVYDRDLQTRLMDNDEALYLLERLKSAR